MKTKWQNLGAREGLYVLVRGSNGMVFRLAFFDDADALVKILNDMETAAALGWQRYQDQCEGVPTESRHAQ